MIKCGHLYAELFMYCETKEDVQRTAGMIINALEKCYNDALSKVANIITS